MARTEPPSHSTTTSANNNYTAIFSSLVSLNTEIHTKIIYNIYICRYHKNIHTSFCLSDLFSLHLSLYIYIAHPFVFSHTSQFVSRASHPHIWRVLTNSYVPREL
ncbi:hypothetical protein L2E82_06106 [Cichorium intybus]|uniref:Uncharacterized protein n=1 Tax=Cichorium intybus TaxID=13427 RepID=A0ACB9H937_CICIN|nr:hypothetical protein L2E82_06106 [Cichorium intybus]